MIIEISDDGAGLDCERVRRKAIDRGLVTAEQAARMNDREVTNLIFLPGFSTAEKVTNVSGRGVGMDVVKTNIEKIGGTVDLQFKVGQGSTVRMKIPLTLAIIPALVVTSAGDRYAIPQVSLLELVRLEGEQLKTGIELVQGAPVHRLRGQLLPLVYLNRALDVGVATKQGAPVNIVVLRADERQFGLIVDEVNDTEEIVVKPLGKQLKGINTFAGATIMGDGRVALILDVLGIGQRANVLSELRDRAIVEKQDAAKKGDAAGDRQTLLLFQCAGNSLMALPLSMVSRLEEFPRNVIERTGQQEVVQYRGQIMPLVRISQVVYHEPAAPKDEQKPLQVVVYSEQNRRVGLVVDRILDIVEENLVIEKLATRPGVHGSAVIQKRVADVLDVQGVVRAAHPQFFESRPAA